MKKKFLTLFLPLMAFACLFTACSDDDDLSPVQPIMPITYSLPAQMKVDTEDYVPVLIKTEAEFDALFSDYKDQMGWVDFNKYDFVYMQGYERGHNKIKAIESWIDTSVYPYELHVYLNSVFVSNTTNHEDYLRKERWAVAFLLPKSDSNKVIYDTMMYAF